MSASFTPRLDVSHFGSGVGPANPIDFESLLLWYFVVFDVVNGGEFNVFFLHVQFYVMDLATPNLDFHQNGGLRFVSFL